MKPLLNIGLLQVLLDDLQAKLRRGAGLDVLRDAGEDLRQILLFVLHDLLLALLRGTNDALGNVRVDGGHERGAKGGPVDDTFAVEGLRGLDDRGPLLRHPLEVGRLHIPREVEVELLIHVALVEELEVRVFDAHHAERDLIHAVLLVELPHLAETLGKAAEELIDLKLVVDRVDGGIAITAGKAVVLLERSLKQLLGLVRVHVRYRTVGVVVLVRAPFRDHRTWTPAAWRAALRVADGREDAQGGGINAGVLVRLDLVLPRLARLGQATGVMELAAQVLAPV